MTLWIPKSRGQLLTALCAIALLATNVFGDFRAQRIIVETVDGIDDKGNPDPTLGFDGPGKSYKNINRGIIVQINKSIVDNLLLVPKHVANRGLPILDPQTNESITTTKDLLIVEQKKLQAVIPTTSSSGNGTSSQHTVVDVITLLRYWQGTQIKVYDPRYPVLTPQTTTP